MKKILFLGFIIAGVLAFYYWKNPLGAKVKIKNQVFLVEVAVTPKQRERGLSGRKSLGENRGMLFLFGQPGVYHFWMKDMLFPLDFVWMKGNTIVQLNANIPPPKVGEAPVELSPKAPIDKVLEVNSGTIQKLDIVVGDKVEFVK
ncbi:DUF192 domain-containing protein [Candidatus Jorgensenbacteria bacterium]|nr:DUF192 domain-containing protein [Candidatus Jorgensenbacteria bacterium]